MVLILPLNWLLAMIIAAGFHELCHFASIRLCGGNIQSLSLSAGGAAMKIPPMSPGREWFCAVAGPIGGFLLVLLYRWFPRIALCAFAHSIFNLLPVYPLDGGRATRCALALVYSDKTAERICCVVEKLCLITLLAFGFYLSVVMELGLMPVAIVGMMIIRAKRRKTLQTGADEGTIVLPFIKGYGYDRETESNSSHRAEACPVHRRRIQ